MAGYHNSDATVSARDGVAVTPSDATVIPVTRALYIGTSGNLTVRMAGTGNQVLFVSVATGIFPVQVDRVYSTGTAALNIVALY